MAKSITVVVPPNAAATVPESKSSALVRVRVDAAGKHQLAAGVDHLVGLHGQVLADGLDRLALDVDVGEVVVDRGDHPAVLDQRAGHGLASGVAGPRA
jgi:hypothetical protein